MDFATIFTAFNLVETQLVQSRLEAAGFHPFIANENVSSWLGGYSTATTIRLQVPEAEAKAAKEFLDTTDQ
jgi:Putative prokaryotic signal transducing protein